jgi:hypothetical protein
MPKYLSTTTRIGICDRCRFKVEHDVLKPDGNSPGLLVCPPCNDEMDPYRKPSRQTESYVIRNARPDEAVVRSEETDGTLILGAYDHNILGVDELGNEWYLSE